MSYHTATKSQVTDTIFKLNLTLQSVQSVIKFAEFQEFIESTENCPYLRKVCFLSFCFLGLEVKGNPSDDSQDGTKLKLCEDCGD